MNTQPSHSNRPLRGGFVGILRLLGRPFGWLAGRYPVPFFVVLFGLLVIGLLVAFVPKRDDSRPASPPPPLPVEVVEVQPVEVFRDTFRQPGEVAPNRTVDIAAEVAARVERYAGRDDRVGEDGQLIRGRTSAGAVAEGDAVRKGQPILQLNTDLLRAERDRAKADFEYQKRELARIKQLFEQNVATASEVDTVRSAHDMAKAALELAEAHLERAVIVSPIDGSLNDIPVEVGEYVSPGVLVARVVEMDPAVVVFDVSEKDIGFLGTGDEVTITHGLVEIKELTGRIRYISELAAPASRTTCVEVEVPNPAGPDGKRRLRDKQIVEGKLTRRVLRDILLIPMAAIIPLENGKVVYVVEDGKARRREITIDPNLTDDQRVCVTDGIQPGAKLIVKGLVQVGPGQPVSIQPARTPVATQPVPTAPPAVQHEGD